MSDFISGGVNSALDSYWGVCGGRFGSGPHPALWVVIGECGYNSPQPLFWCMRRGVGCKTEMEGRRGPKSKGSQPHPDFQGDISKREGGWIPPCCLWRGCIPPYSFWRSCIPPCSPPFLYGRGFEGAGFHFAPYGRGSGEAESHPLAYKRRFGGAGCHPLPYGATGSPPVLVMERVLERLDTTVLPLQG